MEGTEEKNAIRFPRILKLIGSTAFLSASGIASIILFWEGIFPNAWIFLLFNITSIFALASIPSFLESSEERKIYECNVGKFLSIVKTRIERLKLDEEWDDYNILRYVHDMFYLFFGICKNQHKKFSQQELDELIEFKDQLFTDFPNNPTASQDMITEIGWLINEQTV